jgi:hypothetical protein
VNRPGSRLTIGSHAAEGVPDNGIEPVEDLWDRDEPLQGEIAAFEMRQFMEEDEPNFLVANWARTPGGRISVG